MVCVRSWRQNLERFSTTESSVFFDSSVGEICFFLWCEALSFVFPHGLPFGAKTGNFQWRYFWVCFYENFFTGCKVWLQQLRFAASAMRCLLKQQLRSGDCRAHDVKSFHNGYCANRRPECPSRDCIRILSIRFHAKCTFMSDAGLYWSWHLPEQLELGLESASHPYLSLLM